MNDVNTYIADRIKIIEEICTRLKSEVPKRTADSISITNDCAEEHEPSPLSFDDINIFSLEEARDDT